MIFTLFREGAYWLLLLSLLKLPTSVSTTQNPFIDTIINRCLSPKSVILSAKIFIDIQDIGICWTYEWRVFQCLIIMNLRGRAVVSPADIRRWQKHTQTKLFGDPALAAALRDPRRVFNMDELSIPTGVDKRKHWARTLTLLMHHHVSGGTTRVSM